MDTYAPTDFDRHVFRLAGTLDFGPEELDRNRDGHLSPVQIRQLRAQISKTYWAVIGILSAVAFVLGTVGVFMVPTGAFWFIPAGILIGIALWVAWNMRQDLEELPDRVVQSATLRLGRMSLALRRWGSREGKATFTIEGDRRLYADSHLYKILRPNQEYAAYYVRLFRWSPGNHIVSIEPVGEWVGEAEEEKTKRKTRRDTFARLFR